MMKNTYYIYKEGTSQVIIRHIESLPEAQRLMEEMNNNKYLSGNFLIGIENKVTIVNL